MQFDSRQLSKFVISHPKFRYIVRESRVKVRLYPRPTIWQCARHAILHFVNFVTTPTMATNHVACSRTMKRGRSFSISTTMVLPARKRRWKGVTERINYGANWTHCYRKRGSKTTANHVPDAMLKSRKSTVAIKCFAIVVSRASVGFVWRY